MRTLRVETKMLGVVNAESTKPNAFTVEDEELLTIIAGQLATAIQRLRTVQAERFQTQQLERSNSLIRALAQVNARAAVAADPQGVLQTLGNELAVLGLRCAIALFKRGWRAGHSSVCFSVKPAYPGIGPHRPYQNTGLYPSQCETFARF